MFRMGYRHRMASLRHHCPFSLNVYVSFYSLIHSSLTLYHYSLQHDQEFEALVPDPVAERIFGKSAKLLVHQVSDVQTTQGTAAVIK